MKHLLLITFCLCFFGVLQAQNEKNKINSNTKNTTTVESDKKDVNVKSGDVKVQPEKKAVSNNREKIISDKKNLNKAVNVTEKKPVVSDRRNNK
ncbi:MAG: hypothetical protein ABIJ97_15785 [Bacteroidota bacterium]